jgi:hypothetical protein
MELQSLVLDPRGLPDLRFEPIADVLNRAAAADKEWKPFFERLLDVVIFLESCKPTVQLHALLHSEHPPTLVIFGPNKASVEIRADYFDRTPAEAHPGLHFRLQIKRDGSKLPREVRTRELAEVARQIRLAFSFRDA